MAQSLAEQIAKLELDVNTYGLTRDKTRLRLLKEQQESADAARKPKPPPRARRTEGAKDEDE